MVDAAEDVQHGLMLRLLFYTGVRVSELCSIEIADVDVENCKIRINQGKGSKDRFVLFGTSFAMALRAHVAAHPDNRYLFQTRRCGKFSTRRVQQVVKLYAEKAGVTATPHTFRHQAITFLTQDLRAGGCRTPAHHRARPAGNIVDIPARLCRWGDG